MAQKGWKPDQFRVAGKMSTDIAAEEAKQAAALGHAPPPLGSIITFRYQELSDGGVPRFPTYVGVRHDVAWKSGDASGQSEVRPAAAKPGSRRK